MSAFGSSVINKSNKKLAPKAPVRRRHVASSTPAPRAESQTISAETRIEDTPDVNDSSANNRPPSAPVGNAVDLTNPRVLSSGSAKHVLEAVASGEAVEGVVEQPRKRRRITKASATGELPSAQESEASSDDRLAQPAVSVPISPRPQETSRRSRQPNVADKTASATTGRGSAAQERLLSNRQKASRVHRNATSSSDAESAAGIKASRRLQRAGHNQNRSVLPQNRVQIAGSELAGTESIRDEETAPSISHEQPGLESGSSTRKRTRKTAVAVPAAAAAAGDSYENEPAAHNATEMVGELGAQGETAASSATRSKNQATSAGSRVSARQSIRRHWQRKTTGPNADSVEDQANKTGGANEDRQVADAVQQSENQEDQDGQDAAPRKKRRKRKATPDEAEEHEIDPVIVTMYDLCKDSGRGKKSRLESEMQEVDWTEVVRRRKEMETRARAGEIHPETQATEVPEEAEQRLETAAQGPQLKLVNGQIVVDTSSLVVDRHAAARPDNTQPAVEERDITRRINSQSWINDNKRHPEDRYRLSNKSDPWSVEATDEFYSALRMFGTDFMMISKMFPGRTRRHIKLKFVREERANADRIKDALVGGSVPMDLQAYCRATGQRAEDYKDPEDLEEELRADEERQRAEIERQKEEQAEAQRKKQEAAAAKAAAGRQRKAGDKTSGKDRKRKQDGAAPKDGVVGQNAVSAEDAVIETIELQTSVPVAG